MIISRRDVHPAATGKSPDEAYQEEYSGPEKGSGPLRLVLIL